MKMNKKYYKLLFIVLLLLLFTINVKVFAEEINDNEQIEEIVEEEKNDYYSNSKYELIIEDDANLLSSNEKLVGIIVIYSKSFFLLDLTAFCITLITSLPSIKLPSLVIGIVPSTTW